MPKETILQGSWDLAEHEREVALCEAAGWEVESIAVKENGPGNLAKFKQLPIGDKPKRVRLALKVQVPPANCGKLFDCEMYVEGGRSQVSVYREK